MPQNLRDLLRKVQQAAHTVDAVGRHHCRQHLDRGSQAAVREVASKSQGQAKPAPCPEEHFLWPLLLPQEGAVPISCEGGGSWVRCDLCCHRLGRWR